MKKRKMNKKAFFASIIFLNKTNIIVWKLDFESNFAKDIFIFILYEFHSKVIIKSNFKNWFWS